MKPTATLALLAACLAAPLPALAHGPTPQKVDESVEIAAPPEKV
jgi:mxaD protein